MLVGSCSLGLTDSSVLLNVSVELSAASVRPAEPVIVTVKAVNRGRGSVTVDSGFCPEGFIVVDTRGNVVGPAGRLCALEGSQGVLEPGEELVLRQVWEGDELPDGEYFIRGRVAARKIGLVESEPVRIVVGA